MGRTSYTSVYISSQDVPCMWIVVNCSKQDRTTDGELNPVIKWVISGYYVNRLDPLFLLCFQRGKIIQEVRMNSWMVVSHKCQVCTHVPKSYSKTADGQEWSSLSHRSCGLYRNTTELSLNRSLSFLLWSALMSLLVDARKTIVDLSREVMTEWDRSSL